MRPIPEKLKQDMNSDPFYEKCIRLHTGNCGGNITWEHAIIYAGKQVNEKWAIVPVCEKHHAVNRYQDHGDLDKRYHEWTALTRLFNSDEEYQEEQRKKYSRAWSEWQRKLLFLNKIYEREGYPASLQK